MRFHLVMLIIVILVSLGMHGLASAGQAFDAHGDVGAAHAAAAMSSPS